MSRIVVVLGTRGPGLGDALAGVERAGDVVVAALDSTLDSRVDAADLGDRALITAADPETLAARVVEDGGGDAVVTFADDGVVLAALLADRLGAAGIPLDHVGAFRDKFEQRRRLAEAGMRVPEFFTVDSETTRIPEQVHYPAVVKPTRGSGGALAFVVASEAELREAAALSLDLRGEVGSVDDASDLIVEEVIVGTDVHSIAGFAPYVSVETATVDGVHRHLGVTDRFPLCPPVLETGMSMPSALPESWMERVTLTAGRALDALNLRHGISHTELMLTADGPVVIEVNARVGGAVPYLFGLSGGPNLFELAARVALGELPEAPSFAATGACVVFQHPLGVTTRAVTGFEPIRALPGTALVLEFPAPDGPTTAADTMAGLALATTTGPAGSVAYRHRCLELFSAEYGSEATPAYFRRTPDGVVHPGVAPRIRRLAVDTEICAASGVCGSLAPDRFKLDGDHARVLDPDVAGDAPDADRVEDAVDCCPTQAITLLG